MKSFEPAEVGFYCFSYSVPARRPAIFQMHFGFLIIIIPIALLSKIFSDWFSEHLETPKHFAITPKSSAKQVLPAHFFSHNFYKVPILEDMTTPRAIRNVFLAIEQGEGAGARVRRSIGGQQLREFSPFLMLDHFSSTSLAGFPDHPHRGQGKKISILSNLSTG